MWKHKDITEDGVKKGIPKTPKELWEGWKQLREGDQRPDPQNIYNQNCSKLKSKEGTHCQTYDAMIHEPEPDKTDSARRANYGIQ